MGYHRRSVAKTAMFRIKTQLCGHLILQDNDASVGEAMAMAKALNRMKLLDMPDRIRTAYRVYQRKLSCPLTMI